MSTEAEREAKLAEQVKRNTDAVIRMNAVQGIWRIRRELHTFYSVLTVLGDTPDELKTAIDSIDDALEGLE